MSTQTSADKQAVSYALPLVILGTMFFSIGFALGINSYLIPLLNQALDISSSESYLVLAATFSAFSFRLSCIPGNIKDWL